MAGPAVTADPPSRPGGVNPLVRFAFFAVIGLWLLLPLVLRGNLAQDALPYVVAGQLVRDDPHQIYATDARDVYDMPPAFAIRSCNLAPEGTDCANFAVGFVSSPPSLPFAFVLGLLGPNLGTLLARVLAAASLSGGMLVLWNRFTARNLDAAPYVAATAVLLTPFATVPIALGQTSPYLFLLACLGVTRTCRPLRAVLTAGLFAGVSLLKLFPVLAGLVMLAQKRWRLAAIAIGWAVGLAGLAAALGPMSWYSEFVTTSKLMAGFSLANPYNGAVAAMAHSISPSLTEGIAYQLIIAAMAGKVAVVWFVRVRHANQDTQWAFGLLVSLFFVPLVWWHYLWVAVAAVAIAIAARRELTKQALAVLPVVAAITIPISIPNGSGGAAPWARFLFLAGAAVLTVGMAGPETSTTQPAVAKV